MESFESKFSSEGSYTSDISSQQAARHWEQVDQRLSCPVCLDRFDDPRLLDCTHSYCKKCLVNVLTKRLKEFDDDDSLGGEWNQCVAEQQLLP